MAKSFDRMAVIRIAEAEVGYLEKSAAAYRKNPAVLDQKTAGAGTSNYTKYGRDMHRVYPSIMDFPAAWCDCFVDWCFYKAYGISTAKSLLGGNFDDYTVASARKFKNHNALNHTPEVGAQIFFTRNGSYTGCYHTGLVISVSADRKTVTTIEGNTSAAGTNIVANGGCVAKKVRKVSNNTLFGHPAYNDGYGVKKPTNTINFYSAYRNGHRFTVNTKSDPLNLRESAGTGALVTTMPKGATVITYGYYTVIGGVTWWKVVYKNSVGWASAKYLR
jgi:hypothetical protein